MSSTTRRMQLGSHLRKLRESQGLTRAEAGFEIRASESKISRLELGRVGFKERDVADLLTLYGVTDPADQAPLLALAAEANAPGWWQPYNDLLPPGYGTYLGLEESASLIRSYECQFIPPLLQTEDYARAILASAHPRAKQEELDQRVNLTLRRQEAAFRPDGPRIWIVLDEAVLHRPVGTPDAHRRQLKHLLTLPATLQILPYSEGPHPAASGSFTLLRFPYTDLQDIAYTQSLTCLTAYEKREDVDVHLQALEHLCVVAPAPDSTPALISSLTG